MTTDTVDNNPASTQVYCFRDTFKFSPLPEPVHEPCEILPEEYMTPSPPRPRTPSPVPPPRPRPRPRRVEVANLLEPEPPRLQEFLYPDVADPVPEIQPNAELMEMARRAMDEPEFVPAPRRMAEIEETARRVGAAAHQVHRQPAVLIEDELAAMEHDMAMIDFIDRALEHVELTPPPPRPATPPPQQDEGWVFPEYRPTQGPQTRYLLNEMGQCRQRLEERRPDLSF